jgi:hypothetical protein
MCVSHKDLCFSHGVGKHGVDLMLCLEMKQCQLYEQYHLQTLTTLIVIVQA